MEEPAETRARALEIAVLYLQATRDPNGRVTTTPAEVEAMADQFLRYILPR